MTNYQNKRKQQGIMYKLTMLSDTKSRIIRELKEIDTSISLLQEQRLELTIGGLK